MDPSTFYQIMEFLCPNIDQAIADLVVSELTISTKSPSEVVSTPSPAPLPLSEPPAKATSGPSLLLPKAPSQKKDGYSNAPSQRPSGRTSTPPSEIPLKSVSPSDTPTTSSSPSEAPSNLPTAKPSAAEINLLCFSFSYTLGNTAGFSAEEILFETNNRIKQGLLVATRNITISVLNATMTGTPRMNIFGKNNMKGGMRSLMEAVSTRYSDKSDQVTQRWSKEFHPSVESSSRHQSSHTRHLAFYTDDHPARIGNVVDSLFCYDKNDSICVSVFSEVCVVLAAGESASAVRTKLIQGFRSSIESGAFNHAIPSVVIP